MFCYILNAEGEPVSVGDVLKDPTALIRAALWFEHDENRQLALDYPHGVCISTVFLMWDQSMGRSKRPVLWETMIMSERRRARGYRPGANRLYEGYQRRYASQADALRGHAATIRLVQCYYTAPRKTKKAMKKLNLARIGRRERRRLNSAAWWIQRAA